MSDARDDPSPDEELDPLIEEVEVLLWRAVSDDDPAAMGVRLVHRGTGIKVESVTERSQIANRDIALRLLREAGGAWLEAQRERGVTVVHGDWRHALVGAGRAEERERAHRPHSPAPIHGHITLALQGGPGRCQTDARTAAFEWAHSDDVARRQVGDPWYTVLYKEPATAWWATPAIGTLTFGSILWFRDDPMIALIGASAFLFVGFPGARWRHRHPDGRRRWEQNAPLPRPGEPL